MPELPDLQVFSQNLTKMLAGKKVSKVEIRNKKKIKIPVKKFQDTLEGQKVEQVYRDGKELNIEFSKGDILALHLM
jgi:formamidopyrimidine-DNA glycosylase